MMSWRSASPDEPRIGAALPPRARRLLMATAALAALPGPASGQADRREDVVRTAPGAARLAPDRTSDVRAWTLDVSAITGFDSNPSLTPDDDSRAAGAGGFIGAVVNGSYRLFSAGPWSASARGASFWSKPFEASGFSVFALRPSLSADYRFRAWHVPVVASAGYGIDATFVGGRFFNLGHTLSAGATFPVAPLVTATPSYALSLFDFREDGRDTVRHRIGIQFAGPLLFTTDALASWSLGYGFTLNDAKSGLFDYNQHAIWGGLNARLRPGLLSLSRYASSTMQFGFGYANSAYTRYPTTPARRENVFTVTGAYVTPILPRLSGSVVVAHRIADANLAAFSTRRTTLTFALTWRF